MSMSAAGFEVRTFAAVSPVRCARGGFAAKLDCIAFTLIDGREPPGKP